MITHRGSFSVGGLFPTFAGLLAGVIAQLRGQLAGNLRVSGALAIDLPSLDARIKAAAQLLAALQVSPPGVRFNVGANASVIAALQAQLGIIAELQAALGLGTVGVEAYEFEGRASTFGPEVTGETASGLPGGLPSDQMHALVLATRYSEVFDALRTIISV